ncbi:nitroreductase family protein [Staphylococcus aureus]|nr:nitroreductase family protein [Staphylococcus aureus]
MLENRHLYIYDPKVRKTLGIKKDEVLAGFLYLNGFRRRYA